MAALMAIGLGAILLMAPDAGAQQFVSGFQGLTTIMGQGTTTNNVAATATNTYANQFRIDVPKAEYVELYISAAFSASGPAPQNLRFSIAQGADETTFETNNTYAFNLTGNGTTPVNLITNITVGAVPYLKIQSAGNTNAAYATNIVFSYGFKK